MIQATTRTAYRPGKGAWTPWGRADFRYKIAEGLSLYTTPSHGGFRLCDSLNRRIPWSVQVKTCRQLGLEGWYEEDQDALAVPHFIPEAFPQEEVDRARAMLKLLVRRNQDFAIRCLTAR